MEFTYWGSRECALEPVSFNCAGLPILKYKQMDVASFAGCEPVLLGSSSKFVEFGSTVHPVEDRGLIVLRLLVAMSYEWQSTPSEACLHVLCEIKPWVKYSPEVKNAHKEVVFLLLTGSNAWIWNSYPGATILKLQVAGFVGKSYKELHRSWKTTMGNSCFRRKTRPF